MKTLLTTILLALPLFIFSQINDCDGAEVICSSETFDFNPNGAGEQDLAFSSFGCLEEGEHSSAWYYFQINDLAPNNTELAFLIIPENGSNQDYDFALYGPGATCDNLGAPLRCSYASTSPSTGLSDNAIDTSEDAGGDGYVKPIVVNPGQGYFLLIDNYSDDGVGFSMEWAGNGADYLDCDATPPCAIQISLLAQDACFGDEQLDYLVELSTSTDDFTAVWTSATDHLAWLTDPTTIQPDIIIPTDFTGQVSFELEISFNEINCVQKEDFTVNIYPYPTIEGLEDELIYCSNESVTLAPTNIFFPSADFEWKQDGQVIDNNSVIEIAEGGEYILEVDVFGCSTTDTLIVTKTGVPFELLTLSDSTDICEGQNRGQIFVSDIQGGTAPYELILNNGEVSNDFFFPNLEGGNYTVTITDIDGCTAESTIEVPDFLPTSVDLGNDTLINLGADIFKRSQLNIADSDIDTAIWVYNNEVLSFDPFEVNFRPNEEGYLYYLTSDRNGCNYSDSIRVRILIIEQIYIANTFTPNDDNVNDVFFIQGGPSVSHVNALAIYSRWGEKVFESGKVDINDPSVGWNGLHNDETVNPGSYQYITEIELINGEILQLSGSIAILR